MSKKAFVTGGSRGIGMGIVKELAQRGYDVAFTYRSRRAEAEAFVTELEQQGIKAYCLQASLEIPGEGKRVFAEAVEYLGGLDLLVNNAGVTIFESILDLTDENMDFMINLDFRNYFIMMREASRYMIHHGIKGNILNITSTRGSRSYPGDCIYGGLKAGLNRAIGSVALDLAPYGIRVNNVAPGATQIRTNAELGAAEGEPCWNDLGEALPLERLGQPSDIAKTIAFLASEDAGYITGQTIQVDGGLILAGMPEVRDEFGRFADWGRVEKRTDI